MNKKIICILCLLFFLSTGLGFGTSRAYINRAEAQKDYVALCYEFLVKSGAAIYKKAYSASIGYSVNSYKVDGNENDIYFLVSKQNDNQIYEVESLFVGKKDDFDNSRLFDKYDYILIGSDENNASLEKAGLIKKVNSENLRELIQGYSPFLSAFN